MSSLSQVRTSISTALAHLALPSLAVTGIAVDRHSSMPIKFSSKSKPLVIL